MSSEPLREVDPTELVGSVLAERYRVDRLLGEGGMGRVYLAEHVLMKKPVALKVLHPEMTAIPEVVGRFEREAVAAARIDHPNVAQAMDFGRLPDGALYFVLEYVDGKSLRSVLSGGPLDVDRVLAIARQIASALVAAHHVGIVHRDLKPDNVMLVAQPDGTDRVKVLDFGIAKLTAQEGEAAVPGKTLTRVGVVMGTVGYMAPEQALGQAVNHLADMYAFGVMLHEMLTGHLPFVASELTQIIAKQLTEPPPPLPSSVPADLSRLTERLLARDVADRVQSAAELADEIERIARARAVGAGPTAFMEHAPLETPALSGPLAVARTLTQGVRRRGAWVGGALLALFAVLGFVIARAHGAASAADAAASSAAAAASAPAIVTSSEHPGAVTNAEAAPAVSASASEAAPSATARSETNVEKKGLAESHEENTESREKSTERNGATRTKRTRHTRVTEERTVKRTHRRTGPGGIYIPPPSEWFK
ncbi:MAG TPA: serine/threonine-protein kinase [Polyangiaceae bacterium]|nr:serine/threonine-protein kinase [Polyangiaceae bacterium]